MPTPIRVLILEDQVADAELMLHELRRAGFDPDWQRVDSERDYLAALATNPDLILADWSLPQFSGLRALQLLKELGLDFPFIIISGSIGEEAAVEAMRQGAADYLLKDRPARLGPAVEHALYEKRLRDEKRQADQTLYESEQKFRSFVEQSEDATVLTDEEGTVIEWNRGAERIFGLSRSDTLGRFLWDIQFQAALPEQRNSSMYEQLKATILDTLKTGQSSWLNRLAEIAIQRSDGAHLTVQTMAFAIPTQLGFRLGSISRDVTERKQAEEALRDSERQYRRLFEAAKDGILILDASTGQIVDANPFLIELLGYSFEEFQGKKVWEVGLFKNIASSKAAFVRLRKKGYIRYEDLPLEAKDGKQIAVEFISNVYPVDHKRVVQCNIRDITERKRMERAIFLMSDTQRQISHLDDITDIYQLVGQKVLELIESGYVAVSMLDEQAQAMKVVGFYGLGSFYEKLVRTFKIDPSKITYPVKDMSEDELRLFRSGRLEKFEGGLYNILVRKVPKHICNAVERELNLTNIYTMSFTWQDTHFGGLTLLPKHDIAPYKDMIETIMNQASIALKRVRSEEALRQSEESLRKAQQVAHVGSWVWYIQTNSLEWSDEMYHIFGIDKDTFSGELSEVIGRAIHPDDRAAVEQSNLSVARDKKPMPLEYRVIRPDGTVRVVWAEAGDLILDEAGKPAILTGIAQDITGRKRMEEALHQSEALFHSLVESLPQNVFSKDLQGRFTFANQRYCVTQGKSLGAILGKTDFDLHPPELASKYQSDDRRVVETGQILDVVEEHQPLGGDTSYVQVIKAPLYDGKGKVAGILGAFWDITARRRAEETLHLQSAALESAANAIAITDRDGIIQWTNSAFTALTGYAAEESHGHNPRELLRSGLHDVPFYKKLWDTILAGQMWRGEMINRRKDGTLYTEEQTITPVLDTQGHVTHFVSVKQDITERKQAEETLHILSSRQEAILAAIPDILMEVDTNKVYTWANPAGFEFFGEDIIGKEAAFYFEGEQDTYDQVDALFNGRENLIYLESWQRRKDGEKRLLAWLCQALKDTDGNVSGALSSAHDITERKRAEDALTQRASQLLLLNDISRRVASVMDLDELLDTSASLIYESFGYEHVGIFIADEKQAGDLVMKARAGLYASRFHADHHLKLGQGMIGWVALYGKKLLANDVSTEMRFHDPFGDGSIEAELSVPIRSEQGNVGVIDIQSRQRDAFSENDVMVVETLADVLSAAIHNARLYQELELHSSVLEQVVKERTEELSRTKDHIETILNSVGEAIIVFGTDYRIHQVNPAFERLTGYSAAEVELHRYDDPQVIMGLSDDIFRQVSESHGGHDWHGEMQVHHRDDTLFDAAVSISPVFDTQNRVVAFVGAMRDISLLKEVERLKDAFVSNVSHELRTPITSLKLLHHLLEVNPPKQSSYLEQMGRVIDRLNVLIEDLLRLSRLDQGRVEMNAAPVNLNALVTQYITDLTLLAESKQLALVVESSPDPITIQADGGLLGQVLSILLTNALNYTPAGGSVVVSTLTSEREGQLWAGFSVSDTGPGIRAEEQQMLFQRFFRGSVGQASGAPGTGLGLAIAREIMMRHGGRLEVESKGIPGEGTVFTVWLPVKNKTTDELEEE